MTYSLAVYLQFLSLTLIALGALALYNRQIAKHRPQQDFGINGWLYVFAFCVLYVLFYFYYTSYRLFDITFINPESLVYFDSSLAIYDPIQAIQIKTELAISLFFALNISYLAYSFLAKKKLFAKLYIPLHLLVLASLIGVQISWAFNPALNPFNIVALSQIGLVALGALLWMPYMRKSKRVLATFVN